MKRKNWKMPKWMEPYRSTLSDPERVEEFMNCDGKNCNLFCNGPRALICCSVSSQVELLVRLHNKGLLLGCIIKDFK